MSPLSLIGAYMADNSITFPYDQILPVAGGVAGGVAGKIAGAAREVVCPLYKKYPSFMTGQWANSPLASYNDGFLNQFCAPTMDLPAAPTVPFTGGQCNCVNYIVSFTATGLPGGSESGTTVIPGPVDGPIQIFTAINNEGNKIYNWGFYGGTSACGGRRYFPYLTNAAEAVKVVINSVVRQDSTADTCGTLAPQYPKVNPSPPELQVNVPVQISPNINVTVPVSVFAPVSILAPSLKIGDFNVDFNLGGLTISPSLNVNVGTNPPATTAPIQPTPGDSPPDRDYTELLNSIFRLAKRIRECQDCDKDYDFLVTGIVGGSANSITVPIGGIPLTAAVTLVSRPTNAKVQPGRGEPDVVFAGWGWWSGNDYLTTREPIDAQTKLFYAPENPSPATFHYTVTPGYSAQMLMSYKKLKNPVPNV
jgi:hypothetical protein